MRRAVAWKYVARARVGGGPVAAPPSHPDPGHIREVRSPQGIDNMKLACQGGCPESRGHFEDWSRLRAVAGELRPHTVGEVGSKEWRQEDASRMHPQGL